MMVRNRTLVSLASLLAGSVFLSACGGGGSSRAALVPGTSPTNGSSSVAAMPATFTFTFPKDSSSSLKRPAATRAPLYLSSATKSIALQVTGDKNHATSQDIYANVPAGLKNIQVANFTNLTGNGGTAGQCGTDPLNAGNYECTAVFQLPIGDATVTIASWDANGGTGNKLSQQITTLTVVQGVANRFPVSLDGNAAAIALSGTQPCTAGSIDTTFGSGSGTSAVTINVSFTDADSKTIVKPGLPQIQIQDHNSVWQSSTGTLNGTGGTVAFSINQSTQSFTLTPSTVPVTSATVAVRGVPPNSDGLTFTQSHSFTFSASTAPPAHNFLAVVEQMQDQSSGNVYFFNVSLGGAGASDTLGAYTNAQGTTYLPKTNSINEGKPDIDNPEDITFDTGGNLLIANGGAGGAGGDYGNFVCVPSGAIATGAALSTTNETNLHVPDAIAVSSNGTVAIANEPAGAATKVQEFTLPGSGNYTAGSSLPDPNGGTPAYGVLPGRPLVNLPTLTPGTFAVGLTDGGANSRLSVLGPSGVDGTLTNSSDSHLQRPDGAAWDAYNNELVVVDSNDNPGTGTQTIFEYLNFYTVSNSAAPVNVKSVQLPLDPNPAYDCPNGSPCGGTFGEYVAVAPTSGTIAIAEDVSYNASVGGAETGGLEIALYDSSGNALSNGVIAYDGAKTAALACNNTDANNDFVYGTGGLLINGLYWLSSTKLMVLIWQPNKVSVQGIYIYDTSVRTAAQSGYWSKYTGTGGACSAVAIPNGPTQTYFQNLSLVPLAASFKQ